MMLRRITPKPLKIGWQLLKRFVRYRVLRRDVTFARQRTPGPEMTEQLRLQQPVRKSYRYENKLANLRLAGDRIATYTIQPGEVFSFWRCVGPPTAKRGFLPGRNLIGGELKEDVGGGLCQLSGLIYHLALLAKLEIIERHHHSVDIYEEHERFTPLGADATVVYGYRDLVFRNSLAGAVGFSFSVSEVGVGGLLLCDRGVVGREVVFRRVGGGKEVLALDGEAILCRSVYG